MIGIIGNYGDQIEDAVELLAMYEDSPHTSETVKISLIQATLQIFYKRPFETLNVVNNLFRDILNDDGISFHVKDYVAYIYRALENDPEEFRKNFC